MVRQPDERRADSTLGVICGLALAAGAWTLASSPSLLTPSAWLFLAGGMVCFVPLRRRSDAAREAARAAFVVSALALFGAGEALLAFLAASLPAVGSRDPAGHDGAVTLLGAIYDQATGGLTTLLGSLAYFAAGGITPATEAAPTVAAVVAFALLDLVGARLAAAFRSRAVLSRSALEGSWPGWSRSALSRLGGGLLGLLTAGAFLSEALRPWLYAVPLAALVGGLALRGVRRGSDTRDGLDAAGRGIARALALARWAEPEARARIDRRRALAIELGRVMGLSEQRLEWLESASWLFDIDYLEDDLLPEGRAVARAAPRVKGGVDEAEIARRVGLTTGSLRILTHRFERWDGAGMPDGLAGAQIPLGSRVLAVAASYASMTSASANRPPLPPSRALGELRVEAGRIFDPRVVDALAEQLRAELPEPSPSEGLAATTTTATPTRAGLERREARRLVAVQRELHALYEIGRAVSYRLDLEENLTLMLDKLTTLVPHASAVVYLAQQNTDELRARFARGIGAAELGRLTLRGQSSPTGKAVAERRSIAAGRRLGPRGHGGPDWDLDALQECPFHVVLRSALAAPLVVDDRCIGALTLYDRTGRRFGDEERRCVAVVAGHLARAVRSADPASPGYLESLTDPLTGLPNGRYLEICSSDLLPSAGGAGSGFGLLAFRVRELDRVCETDGVAAAERVLAVLARRLAGGCSSAEVPVRYGQDLFVVLCATGIRGELVRRWDRLLRGAEGLPLDLGADRSFRVRLASAHAICPEDGESLDELLDVLGSRLGLAFDRGNKVVPFRLVGSASRSA